MISRLSRNTLILIISNVGGALLSFLLSVLIGRALGEDGLGVYATAMAWVSPLNLLVEFGLGTLMTRDIAAQPALAHDYLRTVTLSRLLIGGAVMSLLIAAAPLLSNDPVVVAGLHISAPMVIILPFYSAFTAIFRAREAMYPIPWLNIGMLAAQVILTGLIVLSGGDILGVLIANVVTSAGQLLTAWAVYRWKFALPSPRDNQPLRLYGLLRRAFPFALAAVFAALQSRITIILLEQWSSTAQVGYFTAANRFLEAARLFPNALFGALFPALTLLATQPTMMERTFSRAMLGLGVFGMISTLGFILLAEWLVLLIFGEGFAPTVAVLQIFAPSMLFFPLRGARTLYWYAHRREGFVNRVNGGVIPLQLTLGAWLIPLYGAWGAALVNVLVEAGALLLLLRPLPEKTPIRTPLA